MLDTNFIDCFVSEKLNQNYGDAKLLEGLCSEVLAARCTTGWGCVQIIVILTYLVYRIQWTCEESTVINQGG